MGRRGIAPIALAAGMAVGIASAFGHDGMGGGLHGGLGIPSHFSGSTSNGLHGSWGAMRGGALVTRHRATSPGGANSARATGAHSANFRGPLRGSNVVGSLGRQAAFRPIGFNPAIYGYPFGLVGFGWSGPLWWALGYPGWSIYGNIDFGYPAPTSAQLENAGNYVPRGKRVRQVRPVPASTLKMMGFGSLREMSDDEGDAIRGSFAPAGVIGAP